MAIEKVIDIKVQGNVNEAVGSLRSQLRAAQAEVATLSDKFGATSAEAAQAARRAAELKDQIGDAKALTDAFNPDAKFKALTASLSGVAGGFAAVQGGMALVGVESENVEATLLKVQSAMALSQGLQAVGESLDSFKQLGAVIKELNIVKLAFNFIETGQIGLVRANTLAKTQDAAATAALTTATAASTAATGTATLGLKLFRLAIIGTGVGALVIGLVALYQNFDKVKEAVYNLLPGLKDIGEFFGNVITSVTDFVGATSDASRALDRLKADADATLALNKRFMQEHGDQVDQYTAKKIAAKNAYLEAIKEDGANVAALGQRLNRELAAIDKEREADRKKNREKIQKEQEEEQKKADDKIKEDAEKDKKATEARNKQLQDESDFMTRLRNAPIEAEARERQNKIEAEAQERQNRLDALQEFLEKENEIENNAYILAEAQKKEFADREMALDIAITDAKRAALDTALNILMQFAGKNKTIALSIIAIQKGLAIADVIVGASKSIAAATASAAPTALNPPFLAPGVVNPSFAINAKLAAKSILLTKLTAGTSIASILAAGIGQAASITSGGGGGGAGGDSGGGGGGAGTNAPQFNVVGATGVNQLAGAIGNREAAPVQAYVVANNVTTAQSLDRNIIQSATLGG
jgi:hypothetical protein